MENNNQESISNIETTDTLLENFNYSFKGPNVIQSALKDRYAQHNVFTDRYSCACGLLRGKERANFLCGSCNELVKYREKNFKAKDDYVLDVYPNIVECTISPFVHHNNGINEYHCRRISIKKDVLDKIRDESSFNTLPKNKVIEKIEESYKEVCSKSYIGEMIDSYFDSFVGFCMNIVYMNTSLEAIVDNSILVDDFRVSETYSCLTSFQLNQVHAISFRFNVLPQIIYFILKEGDLLPLLNLEYDHFEKAYFFNIRSRAIFRGGKLPNDTDKVYPVDLFKFNTLGKLSMDLSELLYSIDRDLYNKSNVSINGKDLFENGLNELSIKDIYVLHLQSIIKDRIELFDYLAFDELAEAIIDEKITWDDINNHISLARNIFSAKYYHQKEILKIEKFIYRKNFFELYELNYSEIKNLYSGLQIIQPFICSNEGVNFLNTFYEERKTHFTNYSTSDDFDAIVLDTDMCIEASNMLKKKFKRTMKDHVLRKFTLALILSTANKQEVVDNMNMTNIKSIKSINWANPYLVALAILKYDFSKLNLRTRVYLNYYIDSLTLSKDLYGTKIMDYLIANGNSLSNENLKYILKNINNENIYNCTNLDDIRKEVINSEIDKERIELEEEYEFNFEKDSVCTLVDNPVERDGLRMRLLSPEDPKVFILGKLTDSCYCRDGAAEESMIYSILMPNSGNIVIEDIKSKEVIGTAWVWYDKENDIYVYDNFEFSKDSMMPNCIDIIEEYSMKLPYKNVHVGLNYNEDMAMYFNSDDIVTLDFKDLRQAEFVESDNEDLKDVYSDYIDEEWLIIKNNGKCIRKKEV